MLLTYMLLSIFILCKFVIYFIIFSVKLSDLKGSLRFMLLNKMF